MGAAVMACLVCACTRQHPNTEIDKGGTEGQPGEDGGMSQVRKRETAGPSES